MLKRKGILLAGGTGSRLWPITLGISKQLLPVYDKPMIYYPLSVLMLSGIKEIAIISTPDDIELYKRLLGTGEQWGIEFTYLIQNSPDGLAQAFVIAENFLDGHPSVLVLGDNVFFGDGLSKKLSAASSVGTGASVFGYKVSDPERYGVVGFNKNNVVTSITEKPKFPASNYAVTGLYFLDSTAPERAKGLTPSARGELEITSILDQYLSEESLSVEILGRGYAWLDTGTHGSLIDAGNFVRTLENRQGVLVGSPDEVAFRNKWITIEQLEHRATIFEKNEYGKSLKELLN